MRAHESSVREIGWAQNVKDCDRYGTNICVGNVRELELKYRVSITAEAKTMCEVGIKCDENKYYWDTVK